MVLLGILIVGALLFVLALMFANGQLGNVLPVIFDSVKPHASGISLTDPNQIVIFLIVLALVILGTTLLVNAVCHPKVKPKQYVANEHVAQKGYRIYR